MRSADGYRLSGRLLARQLRQDDALDPKLKSWGGTWTTLVITSTLDEVSLDCSRTLHRGIRGSKLVVIPGARHLAMVEKPGPYVAALRTFLTPLA